MKSRFVKLLSSLSLISLLTPSLALAFDPNFIISDDDMTDVFALDYNQIQAFLDRGALGDLKTPDWQGRNRYAADIIWRAAQNNGISPKVILVLLQKEQSLIEDEDPTQKQLDWATGYAVCDSCSMSDPSLERWKGFGKQVNSATLQFSEGYLADIEKYGVTSGNFGPGKTITIDGIRVTPQNAATAALYAYTPHLEGNRNFAYLWQTWFGRNYPSGTLVQVPGEEGVWLIKGSERRPITSESALRSRYNPDLIIPISATALSSYPEGSPISLPNFSLVKDEDGGIFLLVDDSLRHIDTMETFRSIGFMDDEIVDITNAERSQYKLGAEITKLTVAPQGKLLQLKTNGAVFYVEDGVRHPLLDRSILDLRFKGRPLTPIDPVEVEQYREGKALGLPDGTLARGTTESTVYVIADGLKLPIPSESVFTSYGYKWENVITVPDNVIKLHPTGDSIEAALEDTVTAAGL